MNNSEHKDMIAMGQNLVAASIGIDITTNFKSWLTVGSGLIAIHIKGGDDNPEYVFSSYFYKHRPEDHLQQYKEVMWHLVGEEEEEQ